MISYITGIVLKTNISKDSYVDLQTDSGLGYRVNIPSTYTTPSKGEKYSLFTHFHVREDDQTLYGFEKEEQRDFFEQLIGVSGIGPKIAIAILSTFSRNDLESIILNGDAKGLSKVSGLGLKGAQKIILELRGVIDFEQKETSDEVAMKELKEALSTLGFSGQQLKDKLKMGEGFMEKNKDMGIEELLKKVLSE